MPAANSGSSGFTKEEREAMNARSRELAAEKRADKKRADGEESVRAAIAELSGSDRQIAERIHELVTQTAPDLWPKTWYGMPAYASDGKVVCFFQPASKFGARYATFGFNDTAKLDDGTMWPVAFAVVELTSTVEKLIEDLVKKAVA